MHRARWLVVGCWLLVTAVPQAAALRVLAIGDSMTEEYAFELPFSAPDDNPNPLEANTSNWPELLATYRADRFTIGPYDPSILAYPDLRDGGYKYNYGVPGFKTWDWVNVLETTWLDTWSGDPVALAYLSTQTALLRHLAEVDVVIIFLGGNDLKSNYAGIFDDPEPPALLANVVTNIGSIHAFVKSHAATMPVIIATVPNVGATPYVTSTYNDPTKLLRARARIAAMNEALCAMALENGATLARIDTLTDRIFQVFDPVPVPMQLNGTNFNYPPDPDNEPHALFCKDGFHPATMAQALIANLLVEALNSVIANSALHLTCDAIPPFTNREILGTILGLNPDQPYLDWAGRAGGVLADPDGDGLPNLTEFVLATQPLRADSPLVLDSARVMRFTASPTAQQFATIGVEESSDLATWLAVPPARVAVSTDNNWQVSPSANTSIFYRLAVTPRP
jgi:lysophospholipase L1-like esterase